MKSKGDAQHGEEPEILHSGIQAATVNEKWYTDITCIHVYKGSPPGSLWVYRISVQQKKDSQCH